MSEQTLRDAARISHTDVSDYLTSRAWTRANSRRDYVAIFRSPGIDARQEVHLPLERDLEDYAEAMLEVARAITRYEKRDIVSVLKDLVRARMDTLRFALEGLSTDSGTVRLGEGASLVLGAKKALTASACSVRFPRKYHPRMSSAESESFLKACRLGQTEVGSFVLTIEAPIHTSDQPDDNFGRKTSAYLLRASARLASSIRARDTERLFEESEIIVSGNLCAALVEMMPANEGSDLRLAGSWSPIVAPPIDTPATVTFDRDMFEEIESIGHRLRSTSASTQETFFGTVVELAGEPGPDGPQGEVVLQLLVDEELVRARATLGPQDYRNAGQAHLAQSIVSAFGTLRRGPRRHRLEDPRSLAVHTKAIASP